MRSATTKIDQPSSKPELQQISPLIGLPETALRQQMDSGALESIVGNDFRSLFFKGMSAGLSGDIGGMLQAYRGMAAAIDQSAGEAIAGDGSYNDISVDLACDMMVDLSEVLKRVPAGSFEQLCYKAAYLRIALSACPHELQDQLVSSLLEDICRMATNGPVVCSSSGEDKIVAKR